MTSTRIVGLPLIVLPLLIGWEAKPRWRVGLQSLGLGAVAALGGLLFFLYCHLALGQWDQYLTIQKTGWFVRPDYLALIRPDIYRLDVPLFVDGVFNPNALSRLCVPFTLLCGLAILLLKPKKVSGTFFLAAGLMFFVAVSGLANSGLVSMIRYTFCVHVMLCLAAAHLLANRPALTGSRRITALIVVVTVMLISLTFQIALLGFYTHGHWVS
jgi:hypothetical protein